MPAAVQQQHHHRNTTKVSHKPYKPRFTSKNALKDRAKGKVEGLEVRPRKTRHQEVMSKFDRKNQAKQKRINKHQEHVQSTSVFQGRDGAPRVVAVVALCDGVSAEDAARSLNSSLGLDEKILAQGNAVSHIDRFKQKLQYITVQKDLFSAMDACRMADYVLLVLSAEQEVDEEGEVIIRCVEGQGVSQVYTAVQHMDRIEPPKKRPQTAASLKSFITHFFPSQERVFSLEARQECQNLMRSLCTTTPKGIKWREDRSWMLVEDVRWNQPDAAASTETATAVLTGVVRGRTLHADRLVQVGDWGDYQIKKIVRAPPEQPPKKKDAMTVEGNREIEMLDQPTGNQDTLDELAPEEAVMEDIDAATSVAPSERKSILLDDHQDFEAEDEEEEPPRPKRLPRGTSKYQSAWYLGDVSDSGSDLEDVEDDDNSDDAMTDNHPASAKASAHLNPDDPVPDLIDIDDSASEYPTSTAGDHATDPTALSAYLSRKRSKAAAEDRDFPDEIELHPSVSARERLARYRGLKSSKTSPWLTEEDAPFQPPEWPRLLEVKDYKAAKARVLRETLVGGVKPGTRVEIHLRDVPLTHLTPYASSPAPSQPLSAFALLRHEHKLAPVDVSVTLSTDVPEAHLGPIKSKDELIAQIGPRRLVVNPLFSQAGNTPNDVHKFERYLHPGQSGVASFVGPVVWGAVPVLFFRRVGLTLDREEEKEEGMEVDTSATDAKQTKKESSKLILVGHGTILPTTASPTRIIAKRAILTGEPCKVHKKLVTVRYMFFNRADVEYFKPLRLFTKKGRQGVIKESLGTHGEFKAVFDQGTGGKGLNVMDSVGVIVWKRVWPRWARRFEG